VIFMVLEEGEILKERKKHYPSLRKLARKRDLMHERRERRERLFAKKRG